MTSHGVRPKRRSSSPTSSRKLQPSLSASGRPTLYLSSLLPRWSYSACRSFLLSGALGRLPGPSSSRSQSRRVATSYTRSSSTPGCFFCEFIFPTFNECSDSFLQLILARHSFKGQSGAKISMSGIPGINGHIDVITESMITRTIRRTPSFQSRSFCILTSTA